MKKLLTKEFFKFIIVGILNTSITYLIYLLLSYFLDYKTAYALGYVVGLVFSYFMNSIIVFKSKLTLKKGIQFPFVYVVQFILSECILILFIDQFKLNKNISPLIIVVLTTPVTFLLSKFVIKRG